MPGYKYPIQEESMAGILMKNGSMNRNCIVSKSWSYGTVITPEYKPGIIPDPTLEHSN